MISPYVRVYTIVSSQVSRILLLSTNTLPPPWIKGNVITIRPKIQKKVGPPTSGVEQQGDPFTSYLPTTSLPGSKFAKPVHEPTVDQSTIRLLEK